MGTEEYLHAFSSNKTNKKQNIKTLIEREPPDQRPSRPEEGCGKGVLVWLSSRRGNQDRLGQIKEKKLVGKNVFK